MGRVASRGENFVEAEAPANDVASGDSSASIDAEIRRLEQDAVDQDVSARGASASAGGLTPLQPWPAIPDHGFAIDIDEALANQDDQFFRFRRPSSNLDEEW